MKRINIILIIVWLVSMASVAEAQEKANQNQYWLIYSLSHKFSKNWSGKFYVEDRRYIQNNRDHMFLTLVYVNRKLPKNFSVGAGFMYFNLVRPSNPLIEDTQNQPEFRPYVGIGYSPKLGKWSFSYLEKVEYRIRKRFVSGEPGDDYYTYFRFRQKVSFKRPLLPPEARIPIAFYLTEEVLVHVGNNLKGDLFDQNRFSAGLEWGVGDHFKIRTGYFYWYQNLPNTSDEYKRHVATLALLHSF